MEREWLIRQYESGERDFAAYVSGNNNHEVQPLNLNHVDLSGANLNHANLRYADLCYAQLNDADLSGADLTGANLHGANIEGAELKGTILPDGKKKSLFTRLNKYTD